mgnify:CR=1 FL=1
MFPLEKYLEKEYHYLTQTINGSSGGKMVVGDANEWQSSNISQRTLK